MKPKLEIKLIEEDVADVVFKKTMFKKEKKYGLFSFLNKTNNPIETIIDSLVRWPLIICFNVYILNASGLMNYQNQLLLLNNKALPTCLLIFFGGYVLGNIILGTFNAAKTPEKFNKNFNSLWFPIKMSLLGGLFVPFISSNGMQTSGMIEIIKQVVYFAQSLT